jgi:hypothetical protein
MTRTYTILATNEELLKCPDINNLKQEYDLVLTVGEPQAVNFLFQYPISRSAANHIRALYNEADIEIDDLYVDCFSHQTLVSATITAKEIGALSLSFSLPVPKHEPVTKISKRNWLFNYKAKKVPTM